MRVKFDELACSGEADTFDHHAPRCRAVNAILLAAGYGTRIRSLFPDTPKALIDVGGRFLIDHLLANLARSGVVESALVVTNDRYHDALRRHLAAAAPLLPTRVISDGTASEEERLGALGDLQLALRRLDRGGDVLVAATDKLLAFELAEPLRFARERAAPVTLCVRMPDRLRLAGRHGCVLLDAAGRIVDFEEKPERPRSNIASLAVYVLTPAAQDLLDDYLRDVGTPESYAEAQRAFRTMQDGSPG
jgi:glucose-1-phosphate thymidylyltransferase